MDRNKEYFQEMKKVDFIDFMIQYTKCHGEFIEMMTKYGMKRAFGKFPSKNHLKRMRKKSLEIEKFGLIFRSKTVRETIE